MSRSKDGTAEDWVQQIITLTDQRHKLGCSAYVQVKMAGCATTANGSRIRMPERTAQRSAMARIVAISSRMIKTDVKSVYGATSLSRGVVQAWSPG